MNSKLIYIWSAIYLGIIYCLTLIVGSAANIEGFIACFILALPFYNHIDKYAVICFFLSNIAYYFFCADEGIYSIYTILAILLIFKNIRITNRKIPLLLFISLGVIIIISYSFSKYSYLIGMNAMLYNIIVCFLIGYKVRFTSDTVKKFIPYIAYLQIIALVLILCFYGYFDGVGLSVSEEVNHNTFGMAVAFLGVIAFLKLLYFSEHKTFEFIMLVMCSVLCVISGSRNGLMAIILTSSIFYYIRQQQQGKVIGGITKICIIGFTCIILAINILPEIGYDIGRYNYVALFEGGGTNRSLIWKTLAQEICQNHFWVGYGPGHFCSEQMISQYLNRDYTHTHNTFFEVWGELGCFGLILFLCIIAYTLKISIYNIKQKSYNLLFSALLCCCIFLSIGESLFANIDLWIAIGFVFASYNYKQIQSSTLYTNAVKNN